MQLIRRLSTKRKLAVIGSGPSAFYTVLNLLKEKPNDFEIDMFEKNPSPFGLVRYGVAPDHPEVKNCIDRFNEIEKYIENGSFKYFGNLPISTKNSKLNLSDLYKNYNLVLFAYGSSIPNIPPIFKNLFNQENNNNQFIIDSFSFVNWYNGNSNYKNLKIPFDKIENISIIGNGNVSIDIARLLLINSINDLSKTDISNNALNLLKNNKIKNINIIARKGILDSKFTNKELRELLELNKFGIYFTGYNFKYFENQLNDIKLDRINKRRISLLNKYTKIFNEIDNEKIIKKTWNLQYLKDPIGIKFKNDNNNNNELLDETLFKENQLIKEDNQWKIKSTNKISSIKNDLLILATGYKCEPLLEFKDFKILFENGKILNNNGKVLNRDDSYCVGWISNGSQGNINNSLIDSLTVSNSIINDLKDIPINKDNDKKGRIAIQEKISNLNLNPIYWNDWIKIHKIEIENGKKIGKPYEKMDFDEMLKVIKN